MGFLSLYSQTDRVYIDAEQQWWVDIRVCLSKSDYDVAQQALGTNAFRVNAGGDTSATMNLVAYQEELVVRSIINWNLTDESDVVLPVTPTVALRESVRRLPQTVFLAIYEKVNDYNTPRDAKQQESFRTETNGRHSAGGDAEPAAGTGVEA